MCPLTLGTFFSGLGIEAFVSRSSASLSLTEWTTLGRRLRLDFPNPEKVLIVDPRRILVPRPQVSRSRARQEVRVDTAQSGWTAYFGYPNESDKHDLSAEMSSDRLRLELEDREVDLRLLIDEIRTEIAQRSWKFGKDLFLKT